MTADASTLRAPHDDGGVLVVPPASQLDELLRANLAARRTWNAEIHGRSLGQLSQQARQELLVAAAEYSGSCGAAQAPQAPSAVFATGHQPALFHPGVWAKNFAVGNWAARRSAAAINLLIDSDTFKSADIVVPTGAPSSLTRTQVAYDVRSVEIPWEERTMHDAALAASFANRVRQTLGQLVECPLIERFWPHVMAGAKAGLPWGAAMAQARRGLESQWGLSNLEIPQSRVCELPSFRWFVAGLLAGRQRFRQVHNDAVTRYRRENRLRSANHPFPLLAQDGPWTETPFWIWSATDPRRRRLFASQQADGLALTDRGPWQARLPLSAEGDPTKAIETLAEWSRQGVKLRTRALTTTLYARLLLCDLFVHGLGGGKYDAVTDDIMQAFFGIEPPRFSVVTATVHLPLLGVEPEAQANTDESVSKIDAELHRLRHHPEVFLAGAVGFSDHETQAIASFTSQKRRWVETEPNRANARQRCLEIRTANQALQPYLAQVRARLEGRRTSIFADQRLSAVRRDREYAFCLFPAEKLRNFLLEIGLDSG